MSVSDQELNQLIDAIFSKYDKDKNLKLDPNEIKAMLSDSYKKIGKQKANSSQIRDMIRKYDKNRDGLINKDELQLMMKELLGLRK